MITPNDRLSPAFPLFLFICAVEDADAWVDRFPSVIQQRKALAVNTKANPVTKVAQRLAEVDEDECVIGSPVGPMMNEAGQTFLASIHREIDSVNIADLRRYVASNQSDSIAAIHLARVNRFDEQETEEREQDKKKLAKQIA